MSTLLVSLSNRMRFAPPWRIRRPVRRALLLRTGCSSFPAELGDGARGKSSFCTATSTPPMSSSRRRGPILRCCDSRKVCVRGRGDRHRFPFPVRCSELGPRLREDDSRWVGRGRASHQGLEAHR